MTEVRWVDPARVVYKISPIQDLVGTQGGDWDIARRSLFAYSPKCRAIVQRFNEGRRWEDTDLFRDIYRRRFETDDNVRGACSYEDLVAQYYDRVDKMYHDMRTSGFRLAKPKDGKSYQLPEFLIGRAGDVFIGNQGNHRLAIAQLLRLDKIAARIRCRHESAS